MRVVVEDLEEDGAMWLPLRVLVHGELRQLTRFQRLACHRVGFEPLDEGHDVNLKAIKIFKNRDDKIKTRLEKNNSKYFVHSFKDLCPML